MHATRGLFIGDQSLHWSPLSFAATQASSKHIYNAQIDKGGSWIVAGARHIGVGVLCAIVTAALSLKLEKDVRNAIMRLIKRKRE